MLDTPLGIITVVEADGYVARISSGASGRTSETTLLRAARDQLAAYFSGHLVAFDLPIAPAGSSFQRAVWDAMCRIPYGETRTYGALAEDLASTPRSVGQACGTNPIPIIIPCHRVVGSTGRMVGFSGFRGIASKKFLLGLEGVLAPLLPFEHAEL